MGLFEFVFGKGAPKDENAPKQAFYLNNDDAKTFGNIEYMRSSKTVKRTFAKKKGQAEHLESVKSISAMAATEVGANNNGYSQQPRATFSGIAASVPVASASSETQATSGASAEKASTENKRAESAKSSARRSPSQDMDMFRNMAKSIRK